MEQFIKVILTEHYGDRYKQVYDGSCLIQYLDKKMKAIHGNSKTRRSLANIYAIYSLVHHYIPLYYNNAEAYKQFKGFDYMLLFNFYRGLYGGNKLQNHALNSRVNGEFLNKFPYGKNLIIINNGRYALHIDYLYVDSLDISKAAQHIIIQHITLLEEKDHALIGILSELGSMTNDSAKKLQLTALMTEDAEARIFEIISYAVLRNHYKNN